MLDDRLQRTTAPEPDDWTRGSRSAPVILLEYGDFECPYCAATAPVLHSLIDEYPDSILMVFRHFPLTSVHPHSGLAAEAAECAGAQGRFFEMHDLLYRYQRQLSDEYLSMYAARIGCDVRRFEHDLRTHAYLPEVRRDFRRGIQDGVNGTPTIFINGRRYDGPRDRMSLLTVIGSILQGQPTPPRRPILGR